MMTKINIINSYNWIHIYIYSFPYKNPSIIYIIGLYQDNTLNVYISIIQEIYEFNGKIYNFDEIVVQPN